MRASRARPDMAGGSFWQGWRMGKPGGGPRYGELGQGGVEDLLSKTLTRPHLLAWGPLEMSLLSWAHGFPHIRFCYPDATKLSSQQ